MQENSRDELLKKIFDRFCKLSDNQLDKLKKFIEEEIENAGQEQ